MFDVQSIVELHSREAPVKRPFESFDPFDPFDLTVTGNPQSNPAAKMAAFPDSVSHRQNTCARALTGKAAVPAARRRAAAFHRRGAPGGRPAKRWRVAGD